jgi:hypothetical protein
LISVLIWSIIEAIRIFPQTPAIGEFSKLLALFYGHGNSFVAMLSDQHAEVELAEEDNDKQEMLSYRLWQTFIF